MKTEIGTCKWMAWHVGPGKRFEDLPALLEHLEGIAGHFSPFHRQAIGWAGGPLDEEIRIVKGLIKDGKNYLPCSQ